MIKGSLKSPVKRVGVLISLACVTPFVKGCGDDNGQMDSTLNPSTAGLSSSREDISILSRQTPATALSSAAKPAKQLPLYEIVRIRTSDFPQKRREDHMTSPKVETTESSTTSDLSRRYSNGGSELGDDILRNYSRGPCLFTTFPRKGTSNSHSGPHQPGMIPSAESSTNVSSSDCANSGKDGIPLHSGAARESLLSFLQQRRNCIVSGDSKAQHAGRNSSLSKSPDSQLNRASRCVASLAHSWSQHVHSKNDGTKSSQAGRVLSFLRSSKRQNASGNLMTLDTPKTEPLGRKFEHHTSNRESLSSIGTSG